MLALKNSITEKRNPSSIGIDEKTIPEILEIINKEESKITEAISRELESIEKAVKLVIRTVKLGGTVYFVGSGTSGRIGILEAAELPPTFGVSPDRFKALIAGGKQAVFKSIEAAEDSEKDGRKNIQAAGVGAKDLVIGVSASGSTPYVIGAIKQGTEIGASTIGLSCNPDTLLSRSVMVPIEVVTGPEVVAGSTRMKAGTAQKIVLNMITTTAMIKLGLVYDGYMVGVQAWNSKLISRSIGMIDEIADTGEDEARKLLEASNWDVRVALLSAITNIEPEEAIEELGKYGSIRGVLSKHVSEEG
jgi:N-acetylmuramic acid 6-phosphate etherase